MAAQTKETKKKAPAKTKTPAVRKEAPEKEAAPRVASAKVIKSKASKRKTNLLKLCAEMNRLVADAVDREVVKRFKIIIDTNEEDITKMALTGLLKEPENTIVTSFDERIQPYVKHYVFMLKRKESKK
jgi:hypothetical protein